MADALPPLPPAPKKVMAQPYRPPTSEDAGASARRAQRLLVDADRQRHATRTITPPAKSRSVLGRAYDGYRALVGGRR